MKMKMIKIKGVYTGILLIALFTACKKNPVNPAVEAPEVSVVVPEDPNYQTVAASIEISPVLEGAKFVWVNASKKAVTLKFKYTIDGINKETLVDNNVAANGTVTIPIFELTNFSIAISNTGGKLLTTRLMGVLPVQKPEAKLTKTGWTATASSEINNPDEELNGAVNIVDAVNIKSITSPSAPSFWQSDYNLDPIFPYPHWLIVDMKQAIKITKVGLNAHIDGSQGFTQFKLEGSVDGIGFTNIGGGTDKTFNPNITTEQVFAVSPATAIRYVKITLLLGSPYPCLGNFEAYARQ
jgi:hypothetical protein